MADPYCNNKNEIHTNSSSFQPGAVIGQKLKPITFYISKITVPKKVYGYRRGTTNHCQNFEIIWNYIIKSMIKIYIDHKNIYL